MIKVLKKPCICNYLYPKGCFITYLSLWFWTFSLPCLFFVFSLVRNVKSGNKNWTLHISPKIKHTNNHNQDAKTQENKSANHKENYKKQRRKNMLLTFLLTFFSVSTTLHANELFLPLFLLYSMSICKGCSASCLKWSGHWVFWNIPTHFSLGN